MEPLIFIEFGFGSKEHFDIFGLLKSLILANHCLIQSKGSEKKISITTVCIMDFKAHLHVKKLLKLMGDANAKSASEIRRLNEP